MGVESNRKVAIVTIHGVGPQQRYVMQDTVAGELADRLTQRTDHKWAPEVFYPGVNEQNGSAQSYGSALRVQREDGTAGTVFDVYEAYWSPIDKGHTNVRAVFSWILKTLFVPLSTTARLPAGWKKLLFDGAYTALAMIALLLLLVAAVFLTTWGYSILAPGHVPEVASQWQAVMTVITSPAALFQNFEPTYFAAIIAAFTGIYLFLQVLVAARQWFQHPRASWRESFESPYAWWQGVASFVVVVLAAVLAYVAHRLVGGGVEPTKALIAAAGGALALRLALSLANDFFVNRIGDVQVYTTRDWNSDLHTLREKITETAQRTIQQVLDSHEHHMFGKTPTYERVYILAHSLGSTIAMDALIRLHQLFQAGTLPKKDWQRIRGLVTFGTALEKTKFFFDLAHPSFSQSYDQWRGQVYGTIFSNDPKELMKATEEIYWTNYWYFTDIVANEIQTYRNGHKKLHANGKAEQICRNVRLASRFPRVLWVHGDYIQDGALWTGTENDLAAMPLLNILMAEDEAVAAGASPGAP